jgi:hypothetical protein
MRIRVLNRLLSSAIGFAACAHGLLADELASTLSAAEEAWVKLAAQLMEEATQLGSI